MTAISTPIPDTVAEPDTATEVDAAALAQPPCLVSFDVETYFQVENANGIVDKAQWDRMDPRLDAVTDRLLALLDEHRSSATFFTLGWVARKLPQIVRRIHAAGHEIACHGDMHDRLHRLGPDGFRKDLANAKKTLEDLVGSPVRGYRAPVFSIDRTTSWAIDILAEAGFSYDSSIQPIRRRAYGVPDAPDTPFRIVGPGGSQLIELPLLTWNVLGYRMPVAGGGYFRLLPLRLMLNGIAQMNRRGLPAATYFHPWEFDPDQPRLPINGVKRFRHYVGLKKTTPRLAALLDRHRSTAFAAWLQTQKTQTWPAFAL